MNQRFVSIWLPYLVTDLFAINKPGLKNIPFAVSTPLKGKVVITAVNLLAEKKGIYIGMALADARAIYPALISIPDQPGLPDKILRRIAEWCIRFTPVSTLDPPAGVILDASGCSHLWGGDAAYVATIIKRIEEKGFHARAAMADTIGAAWAVSRFCNTYSIIEPGKQIEAIRELPPESLRIEAETSERLNKLGVYRIKELLQMKQAILRRRFGDIIVKRIGQATGTEHEFIDPVRPLELFSERLPCLEPIVRIEGIEIALRNLLASLCKRLKDKGKGIRNLVFRGYRVDNKEVSIAIGTSAASSNIEHLFELFSIKLSAIEPALGIELFTLEATHVEDFTPRQENLWSQYSDLKDYRIAEWLDRVCGKIGNRAVYRYLPDEHYWPERSVKKSTSLEDKPTTAWITTKPRPVRLLTPPEPIEVTAPIPDYPPMMFRYQGKLHKIVRADGPERIEQEWWLEEGQHRDYYAVQDEDGCRYWLFRLGHYDAEKTYTWHLHGFFA